MNDKFNEHIRRKLEDLQPTYREKDWARMQSYLHQHGFPPGWSGAGRWLVPSATGLTLASLLVVSVWQYRTNQRLETKIDSLSQTVTRFEQAQTAQQRTESRPDTVYITKVAPATSLSALPYEAASAEQLDRTKELRRVAPQSNTRPTESLRSSQPTASDRLATRTPSVDNQATTVQKDVVQSATTQPNRVDKTVSQTDGKQPNETLPTLTNPTVSKENSTLEPGRTDSSKGTTSTTDAGRQEDVATNQSGKTQDLPSRGVVSEGNGSLPTNSSDKSVRPFQTVETVDADRAGSQLDVTPLKPTSMQIQNDRLVERFNRRTRRIRPATPVITSSPVVAQTKTETAKPESVKPTPTGRFQIGVSGEAGDGRKGVGLYSEVLLGSRWAVGIGLNRLSLPNQEYDSERDFEDRTRRDFRREYVKEPNRPHTISSINSAGVVWQVPITITYRLPLPKGFAVIPSLGVNLSVKAQEQATYKLTSRRVIFIPGPFPGTVIKRYEDETLPRGYKDHQPNNWHHSWMLSAGIEKQWNQWTLQVSPYMTMPVSSSIKSRFGSIPNYLNTTAMGVRARILFRF